MSKKGNFLYGIGTITIIALCVWFYNGYVLPRLPEAFEIPTSYMTGNYRELDSLAICKGQVDCISCFEYTLPQTYSFGYDLIMANRYKDPSSFYYTFEKLVSLTKNKIWDYETSINLNHALEKMDDSLRVIALRHLSHSPLFFSKELEDTIKEGKYASMYDIIYRQEHDGMKGGAND